MTHKRQTRWGGHAVQNTLGIQVRNDDITNLALYHTEARTRLDTTSQAAVLETTGGVYAQNEVEWTPWLRSMVGLRADATRFRVDDRLNAVNRGATSAGIVSPKGGVKFGPWGSTEFYVDAGQGFHSNDARGVLATRDPTGAPITPVTPLVKATGAEVGVRRRDAAFAIDPDRVDAAARFRIAFRWGHLRISPQSGQSPPWGRVCKLLQAATMAHVRR